MYRFVPILKTRLWGGDRIAAYKGMATDRRQIGESWELSGLAGDVSVVAEGADAGKTLEEVIARDKERLLGARNYARFGTEFPLLVKFIDARQDLSIQVHPNDEVAWKRHRTKGKAEMWYVIAADEGARLYSGFRRRTTPEEYAASVAANRITDLLAEHALRPGDVFFLPAGCIHSLGAGTLVAEIQQTSDLTYRIYDFDRRDASGRLRELHTELAAEAIDFEAQPAGRIRCERRENAETELIACPYFTTSLHELTAPRTLDLTTLDSFLIAICIEGAGTLDDLQGEPATIRRGETLLVPACAPMLKIAPADGGMKLLTSRIG
ncbi:MAG: class I mannose-6-phosphate isomerase [Alistipes sp.]|nr:class I mannose-6-phosphate isomerase [Alistipes senegalensis]MCM1249986.1 class I mannose-6-phosphate isomerase [Alistipes sp.]